MRRGLRAPAAAFLFVGLHALAAHAAFERAPWDVASSALGGLVAVSDDGVWGNPAGLASREARVVGEVLACHPFGLAELTEAQVALGVPGERHGIGVGARRFGSEIYAEREARVVVAFGSGGSAVGAALRGLEASGAGFAAIRTGAADAGILADVAGLRLGAVVEAVAGEVPGDPEVSHRRAAVGVSRRAASLRVALELQRSGQDPLAAVVGIMWEPLPALRLHAGARGDPATLTWGFSVGGAGVRADVAVLHPQVVGSTVRVGLRFAAPG